MALALFRPHKDRVLLFFPRSGGDETTHRVQWPLVPVRRERMVVLHNFVQGAPARGRL